MRKYSSYLGLHSLWRQYVIDLLRLKVWSGEGGTGAPSFSLPSSSSSSSSSSASSSLSSSTSAAAAAAASSAVLSSSSSSSSSSKAVVHPIAVVEPALLASLRTSAEVCVRLLRADLSGARVEVVRASCPSRVGARGIVLCESKETIQLVTEDDRVVLVPKGGTVFRLWLPVCTLGAEMGAQAQAQAEGKGKGMGKGEGGRQQGGLGEGSLAAGRRDIVAVQHLEATIFGSHFRFAAFERSKRKWKPQATIKLRSGAARTN